MNEETDGPYARIWLYLASAGGWHTCREVFASVNVVSTNRSKLLCNMADAGYIVQKPGEGKHSIYGVTGVCRVPRFVSVGQVAQAVGA